MRKEKGKNRKTYPVRVIDCKGAPMNNCSGVRARTLCRLGRAILVQGGPELVIQLTAPARGSAYKET